MFEFNMGRLELARRHIHLCNHLLNDLAKILPAEYDHLPGLLQRLKEYTRQKLRTRQVAESFANAVLDLPGIGISKLDNLEFRLDRLFLVKLRDPVPDPVQVFG